MLGGICRNVLVGGALVLAAFAQQPPSLKTLHCASGPACSYVVAEPSGFDASKTYAALFMLDPVARGEVAAEAVRKAADEHGVIVFASNDSQNGPLQASYAAAANMWNDAHQHYRLDPKRAYVAGFSGGGRAALAFAVACNCIEAAIVNGAGMPNGMTVEQVKFPVFLTAGDLDFNYPEVVRLRANLLQAGGKARMFVFHGPHRWAPEDGWQMAFTWIELQEIKSGTIPYAPAKVEAIERALHEYTKSAENGFTDADGYRAQESEALDLAGLKGVSGPLAPDDAAKKVFKDEQKEFERYFATQAVIEQDLQSIADPAAQYRSMPLSSDVGSEKARGPLERHDQALRDLRMRMANMRKRIDKSEHPDAMDQRTLASMLAGCWETAERALTAGNAEAAIELFQAMVEFSRTPSGGHLGLAKAYAVQGNEKKSLSEAKAAVAAGLPPEALKTAPEVAKWLKKPEWQALLTK